MTDRQHTAWLLIVLIGAMVFAMTQCNLIVAGAVEVEPGVRSTFIPDRDTLHLIIEIVTLIIIFWKIALPIGKFIQWKDDHDLSNIRDFKSVNRRVDEVKEDMRARP